MASGATRPLPIGARGGVLAALALLGVVAAAALDLSPARLVPNPGGAALARDFLAAALAPAVSYESARVPAGATPFLWTVALALGRTVVFAAAATSLALAAGLPLGVLASETWWRGSRPAAPWLATAARVAVRVATALMRSVHELLWAVVLLAAMGLNTAAAVVAIAVPYAGTFAKVFSEMLDEAPRDSAAALHGLGARPALVFLFGLFPRALPDMAAYAFYRFECAVRASAVLGFFGYQTVGYYLRLSFEDVHYREVWTYLYALFLLVVLLEGWSRALRRRLVQ